MSLLRPLTSRFSAYLKGTEAFDDAVEVIDVDGPCEWELSPIVSLPDELDRFVANSPLTTAEKSDTLLRAASFTQGRCRMYRVEDAIIADGTVLTRRGYQPIQNCKRRPFLTGEPESIGEAVLCSTYLTELYFGHWLHDGLAHELLARDHGKRPINLTGVNRPNEPGYRKLLDLPADPVTFARVRDLWLLEDWELSTSRVNRLHRMRDTLRSQFPQSGPELVFISRGQMGVGRSLTNEVEIAEALESRGFSVLRPEGMEPDEIARGLVNARIVVGVEGSSMSHVLLAAPRTVGMLTMTHPARLNMHFRAYTGALGMRYGYTIGDSEGEERFSQPVDRLLRTIDLLDTALA